MKTYAEKLRDPRWQRKRLEIMQRDNFTCTQCGDRDQTQNIHHWKYSKEPWDAKNEDLTTVCESCHKEIEECKNLVNGFIKQKDFRNLLRRMNEMLLRHPECHIEFDGDDILFTPQKKNNGRNITLIHQVMGFDSCLVGNSFKKVISSFVCVDLGGRILEVVSVKDMFQGQALGQLGQGKLSQKWRSKIRPNKMAYLQDLNGKCQKMTGGNQDSPHSTR